jgi:hypothetical protein
MWLGPTVRAEPSKEKDAREQAVTPQHLRFV